MPTKPCLFARRFMQKARLESVKQDVGALAARKEGAAPLDCARHRRLVARYWRLVLHTTKGVTSQGMLHALARQHWHRHL